MLKKHRLQWAIVVMVTAGIVAALWLNYEPYDNAVPLDKSFQETIQRQMPGVGFVESPLKFSEYLENITEETGSSVKLHPAATPELFMGVLKKERAVVAIFAQKIKNHDGRTIGAEKIYAARMENDKSYVTYTKSYYIYSSAMSVTSLSHELVIFHYDNRGFVWIWTAMMIIGGLAIALLINVMAWKPRTKKSPPQETEQS